MSAIHYYVHGRGQGHATRAVPILERLHALGHDVKVFAGEDAYPVLQRRMPTAPVRSLPARMGLRAAALLLGRIEAAAGHMEIEPPALVISDGDLPGVLAARKHGIPTLALGHGLTFLACARPAAASLSAWSREAAKARLSTVFAARLVAVNFAKLPIVRDDAVLARPALALPDRSTAIERNLVLCYFRDAPHVPSLRAMAALGKRVVVFGGHAPAIAGVEVRPRDRMAFVELLRRCEAVVATAGSQLISECAGLGVPFFGLHRTGDDEQALNVTMARAARLGDGASMDDPTDALTRFLARLPPPATLWEGPSVVDVVTREAERLVG